MTIWWEEQHDQDPYRDRVPASAPRRRRPRALRILGPIAAAAVVLGALSGLGFSLQDTSSSGPARSAARPARGVSQHQADSSGVAAAVDPAVVDITTKLGYEDSAAAGTGIVLTSSGEVLTNNHVIEGATEISVKLANRSKTLAAHVIGTDPTDDVALLQIEGASGLATVKLGDSSKLTIGDEVVAIGNALNLPGPPKVTQGTVSALHRAISVSDGRGGSEQLSDLIQTDAELAPGNSGGPLLDASGRVVGMNTAAESDGFRTTGSSSTVGFAIPINKARAIATQIADGKASARVLIGATAFLGIRAQDVGGATDPGLGSRRFGDGFGGSGTAPVSSGALVLGVESGGPADDAGLAGGDVIVAFDGKTISSADELTAAIHARHPDDRVSIVWVDQSGGRHHGSVALTTGPAA